MCVDRTMYFEEHLSFEKVKEKYVRYAHLPSCADRQFITCRDDLAPHHRLQSYYGYAFESWCTSDNPPPPSTPHPSIRPITSTSSTAASTTNATSILIPPPVPVTNGWGGDVDTNVQWCCVVKTKLGSTRMVIGGEVDCVRGKPQSLFCCYFIIISY